jgi:hypothetical protein
MIHLLIFIFLTFLLTLLPVISKPEHKISSILTNLQSLKKASFLKPRNLLSNLIYLMNTFEYMLHNTFAVHILWTSGFISWILGCYTWLIQANLISLIFISISIIFSLSAIYDTYNLKLNDATSLKRSKLNFTPYLLIISISVLTMVAFNSLPAGLTTSVIMLLFLYDWKAFKKIKQK